MRQYAIGFASLVIIVWILATIWGTDNPEISAPVNNSQGNKMASSFRAVFVTVPSTEVAKTIAKGLVGKKLAACVNIIPQITSVYEWEGKINEDSEILLMIKTQSHLFDDLAKFVKENHPYDVPEVIGLPIEQGSSTYLDWIKQVTNK